MHFHIFCSFLFNQVYKQLFDLKNICLKLQIQAPNHANFYESQRIALKLKNMHLVHTNSMLY